MAAEIGMLGWPSQPMSLLSDVRSDNLRLCRDAETVRAVGVAYAAVEQKLFSPPPEPTPPTPPTPPVRDEWGAVGCSLRAMGRGATMILTYSGDLENGWLAHFNAANPGWWKAKRKPSTDTAWIVERLA